jgi:O-acetyl-ADP-ribose deacetylase (regulator of RNase III)
VLYGETEMIKYFDGTVFNTGADAIVNTVNCVGIMGTGVALEFKLRYPDMFKLYENKCKTYSITTGKIDYYKTSDGSYLINFPTKQHFKFPSKLEWIERGLYDFINTYESKGFRSVAFPKLGTGNGGLNWSEVKMLMEKILSVAKIDVYICLDIKNDAEGVEKQMLDTFNSMSINQLGQCVKLNEKQKFNLQLNTPYSRFWKISETESIGMKTYSSIFQFFYSTAKNQYKPTTQISIFD